MINRHSPRHSASLARSFLVALAAFALLGCASPPPAGTLVVIGGGLEDTNTAVLGRLAALAQRPDGSASMLIATAASGNQDAAAKGVTEEMEAVRPGLRTPRITRETPADDAAALVRNATIVFFTGGDQKRITDTYRPTGTDGPVAAELRALLARGGTIAGTSAGDAMMTDPMFLTGSSRRALGFADPAPPDPSDPGSERLGPQIGPGMGFLPWVLNDSHFFERHRFGRLVAALEISGLALGLGVGEDDAVEVDLASGRAHALTSIGALLVDARGVRREGLARLGVRAKLLIRGQSINLKHLAQGAPSPATRPTPAAAPEVFRDTPNDRDLGRKLFARSLDPTMNPWRLELGPYAIACLGVNPDGWMTLDIVPTP